MTDWARVLRAVAEKFSEYGKVSFSEYAHAAADELERQREGEPAIGCDSCIVLTQELRQAERDCRAAEAERDHAQRAIQEVAAERDALRAERDRLSDLITATADAWVQVEGIPWEGGIDAAMRAAGAEIHRLRAEREELLDLLLFVAILAGAGHVRIENGVARILPRPEPAKA